MHTGAAHLFDVTNVDALRGMSCLHSVVYHSVIG